MLFMVIFCTFCMTANAAEDSESSFSFDDIYDDQLTVSGASQLFDSLPENTKESLERLGITAVNYDTITSLQFGTVINEVSAMLGANSRTPFCGMAACMGIMLLCSMLEGVNSTLSRTRLSSVMNAVGTMCVCTAVAVPLCQTAAKTAEILNGVSGFMLLYIPILSGLMISAGKEISGSAYYTLMMGSAEVIAAVSSKLVSPLVNAFLALTVTSSLSPKMNLSAICEAIYKTAKWVITFTMSIFVTIISLQTVITSSMDNVSRRALRFAVSSFVPVVGGVLGEALTVFGGSLELLKSGAGVFVIIAAAFLFLPVILECIIWQFSLFLLSSASDILGLSQMTRLFRTISKATAMMLALLLCTLTVLIISTVIILLVGS